jgi:hypothetical protein
MSIVKNVAVSLLLALIACFSAHAQQPSPVFRFSSLAASGTMIGEWPLNPDARIDGLAINNAGAVAFVISHPAAGSAVLTPERVVAATSSMIGRKALLAIISQAVAIDEQGYVIYEASYREGEATHVGVFREDYFEFDVNGPGGPDDFTLTPDGRIVPRAGIVTPPPVAPPAGAPAAQSGNTPCGPNIKVKASVWDKLDKLSPVQIPHDILSQPCPQTRSKPAPQQTRPVASPVPAPAPNTGKIACALPPFPMPSEWAIGAEMKGPLASSAFDGPGPGKQRAYESLFFGHMGSPFRTIQYAGDCSAQLIVIGDSLLRGKFELWTPDGLLTYTQPDGYLQLPGFTGKVLPGALVRRDAPFRMNRRGQIAMPVGVEPGGYAILLATPTGR